MYCKKKNVYEVTCSEHNALDAQVGADTADSWAVDNLQAACASDIKPLVGTHL